MDKFIKELAKFYGLKTNDSGKHFIKQSDGIVQPLNHSDISILVGLSIDNYENDYIEVSGVEFSDLSEPVKISMDTKENLFSTFQNTCLAA